ncbi:MAG: hypothetical protein H6R14_1991 [Proteobacteria bacterium]|nr:hypothetical protein [Pseudomonadota bacterium]
MHKAHRIAFLTAIAALFLSTAAIAADEPPKKEEAAEASIVGNPPPDSPFGKLKIGMSYEEVIAIVGKPTNQHDFCTGKHRIPFYFGDDRARTEAFFKGMGKLDFHGADGGFWGRCGMQKILGLIYIEYDPKATGELPK